MSNPSNPAAERLLNFTALMAVRFAWPLVVVMVLLTAFMGWYAATNLGMNADTAGMLSRDLPFRKLSQDYKNAFPQGDDTLVIVLDGPNADLVEDGAARLAIRLGRRADIFGSVFYPQGDPYFRRNGMLYMSTNNLIALSIRLAEAQPLLSTLAEDPSIRGLFEILGLAAEALRKGKQSTSVAGFALALDRISAVLEARARGQSASLSWLELMRARPVKPGDRRRVIVIQPRLDYSRLQPGRQAMKAVRKLAVELGLTPQRGVCVRLTGSVALNTEELASVEAGASLAGLLSLILVTTLLVVGLRSVRRVVAVFLTLVMGLVWTAAFAAVSLGELNLISVAFAVLFIGLGVDFGIHFALRAAEEARRGQGGPAALQAAARGVGPSLALSATAAAFAFLSFAPTDYRGISELGIIASGGMVVALVFNLTLLPALLTIFASRKISGQRAPAPPSRRMVIGGIDLKRLIPSPATLDGLIGRHAKRICIAALVLGLAGVPLSALMRFDHNPLNLKDLSTESVQTVLELLNERNTAPFTASVLAPNREAARRIAGRLEMLPLVDKAVTIGNFVPTKQTVKLEIIEEMALFMTSSLENTLTKPAPGAPARQAAFFKLRGELKALIVADKGGALTPRIRRLVGALDQFEKKTAGAEPAMKALETALVGSFSGRMAALRVALGARKVGIKDLPANLRARLVAADGRVRIEVFPKRDLTDNRNLREFVEQVRTIAPNVTDSPVGILEGGRVVVAAFYQATGTALLAIVILLGVLLRRFWDVVLVLAPLVLAGILTVAFATLIGLDLNLANIIVLPLLLGLGVASGIHLVKRARAEPGQGVLYTSTPRAVLFSALTTAGSFGSLAISSHRGTSSMGMLLTIAIAMTLLCTLVVLPAMMAWREDRRVPQAHPLDVPAGDAK
ncbi:MAG: MMPL family transporter [Alphaproteobacteria bacterium]|nr:MMPL family transporter [Alphaproteobacteria bacterium]